MKASEEAHVPKPDVWESHLSGAYDWFVSTPVVLHVQNAKAFRVRTGEDPADAQRLLAEWGIAGRETSAALR